MAVQPGQRGQELAGGPRSPLDVLAAAAQAVARSGSVAEAARALATAAARAAHASVAVARVTSTDARHLVTMGVAAAAPSLVAELEGSRLAVAELPAHDVDTRDELPESARRIAERVGADAVLLVPVHTGSAACALELYRHRGAFSAEERQIARAAAYQLALEARAL